MSTVSAEPRWITGTETLIRLGIGHRSLARLVEQGLIGVRTLPGLAPKYDSADVERLTAESTRPATRRAVSSC